MKKSVLLILFSLILAGVITVGVIILLFILTSNNQTTFIYDSQGRSYSTKDKKVVNTDEFEGMKINASCNSDSDCKLINGFCGPYAVNIIQEQPKIDSNVLCPQTVGSCRGRKAVCSEGVCLATCEYRILDSYGP